MELKQNGNDIPDTKLFVETFGTIISCAFCFLFFSLSKTVCVVFCRYEDRMWSQSISVWKRSLHPVSVAVWRRWGLQRRQRRKLMWWGKTLCCHNANNLKCEGLRLMHVARSVQLRITEVNGFQMSQTIINYYSLNLNIQVIRPLHMSGNVIYLCHTQILICSLDEDLLNIANARFWKLAKVYLRNSTILPLYTTTVEMIEMELKCTLNLKKCIPLKLLYVFGWLSAGTERHCPNYFTAFGWIWAKCSDAHQNSSSFCTMLHMPMHPIDRPPLSF